MRVLLILIPIVFFACGPSKEERQKKFSDSLRKAMAISDINHKRSMDSLEEYERYQIDSLENAKK